MVILELKPDDIIILKCDMQLSAQEEYNIKKSFEKLKIKNKIILLRNMVDIRILRKEGA